MARPYALLNKKRSLLIYIYIYIYILIIDK